MVQVELRSAARAARRTSWLEGLARYGLVAKGASYALVAVLAVLLAVGAGGKAASRVGALESIAGAWWGVAVLVVLALGFAAYAVWRALEAMLDREDDGSGPPGLAKRAGLLGRAAIYAGLTYSTLRLLAGSGAEQSQTGKARQATATVLEWPAGRWLVGLAGVCLAGAGLFNGYRAVTQSFEKKWDTARMSAAQERWASRAGTTGLLARMVVFGMIGGFLVRAAVEYDPQEAIGLDGALQKLVDGSYGPVLLGIVALGLLCYGLYCFVEARYRRV